MFFCGNENDQIASNPTAWPTDPRVDSVKLTANWTPIDILIRQERPAAAQIPGKASGFA
jgi:hypothetical protein